MSSWTLRDSDRHFSTDLCWGAVLNFIFLKCNNSLLLLKRESLIPLPVCEEDDHMLMSIGAVFALLLCSSPGVQARCGLFTAIVQLHSTASRLTDWPTADFKNPANRMSALLLLITAYCCFLCPLRWIKIETGWISINSQGKKVAVCVCVCLNVCVCVCWLSYYRCFSTGVVGS